MSHIGVGVPPTGLSVEYRLKVVLLPPVKSDRFRHTLKHGIVHQEENMKLQCGFAWIMTGVLIAGLLGRISSLKIERMSV